VSAEPAPIRRLAPVDLDTGEIVNREIAALTEKIEVLELSLKDAERENAAKRGQITRLKKDKVKERLEYKDREKVSAVMDYYNRRMGRDQHLTAVCFDAIRGMLEETDLRIVNGKAKRTPTFVYPGDFKRAIDGAWHDAYEVKRKNGTVKRHDGIPLIFRDAEKMREFMLRSPFAP
jgi:hypothetical protein